MGFMDIERSKINEHALKRHLLIRTGQGGATLLTPSLTRPPLTRQDFRSPCDVELAGEDCSSYMPLTLRKYNLKDWENDEFFE